MRMTCRGGLRFFSDWPKRVEQDSDLLSLSGFSDGDILRVGRV